MNAPASMLHHPFAAGSAPTVVLDTNVVLDWLLFEDKGCAGLDAWLCFGQMRWHATAAMRGELASVLPRQQLRHWSPNCEHILSRFDLLAQVREAPPCAADITAKLRCRDPDDQKFIDLAVAIGATLLFSKDRALLDLARPARAMGIQVMTPAQWQRTSTASRGAPSA